MTNVEHAREEASFQDVIRVDEQQIRSHVDQVVRQTVTVRPTAPWRGD